MKEFIKKLIERLEAEKSDWNADYNVPINKAISIVNELAGEYKNVNLKTNFDRIKAMSVEEFAMFGVTEPWLAWDKDPNDYEDFLDWLNKEVE